MIYNEKPGNGRVLFVIYNTLPAFKLSVINDKKEILVIVW